MTSKAIETVQKEILTRLDGIAFYFEERDNLCAGLSSFCRSDLLEKASRKSELDKLVTQIQNSEIHLLYELVHLKDNVGTYFRISGRAHKEIAVIDLFKPYRMVAKFVNTHKHGLKGKNVKSAMQDYRMFFFKQESSKPAHSDNLIGICTLLNYDGEVFPIINLINDLNRVWDLFLSYHTDIDTDPWWEKICKVRARNDGKSTYSAPIPKGVLEDAKRLSQERKILDI